MELDVHTDMIFIGGGSYNTPYAREKAKNSITNNSGCPARAAWSPLTLCSYLSDTEYSVWMAVVFYKATVQ